MSAFQPETFLNNYKQRINKKLEAAVEETQNICTVISEMTIEFKERTSSLLQADDSNFFVHYKTLHEDLQRFSEKLFLALNIINSSAPEEQLLAVKGSYESEVINYHEHFPVKSEACSSKGSFHGQDVQQTQQQEQSNENAAKLELDLGLNYDSLRESLKLSLDSIKNASFSVIPDNDISQTFVKECLTSDLLSNFGPDEKSTNLPVQLPQEQCQFSCSGDSSYNSSGDLSCEPSINDGLKLVPEQCVPGSENFSSLSEYYSASALTCFESSKCLLSNSKLSLQNLSGNFNIEFPVPNIVIGSTISVVVSHFVSPSSFWLQLDKPEKHAALCSESHFQGINLQTDKYCLAPFKNTAFYQRAQIVTVPESGASTSNSIIKVFFVDYGNTEFVPARELQMLPESSFTTATKAIHCFLNGVESAESEWCDSALERFQEAVQYSEVQATVVDHVEDMYSVELCVTLHLPDGTETFSMSEVLCLSGLAVPVTYIQVKEEKTAEKFATKNYQTSHDTENAVRAHELNVDQTLNRKHSRNAALEGFYHDDESSNVSVGASNPNLVNYWMLLQEAGKLNTSYSRKNKFQQNLQKDGFDWSVTVRDAEIVFIQWNIMLVNISYINSPEEFYVNLVSGSVGLSDLQEHMAVVYENLESQDFRNPVNELKLNMFCCCPYPEDNSWYRARVLEIHESEGAVYKETEVVVQYIDYGNCGTVCIGDLRPLLREFAELPACAVCCSLSGDIPKSEDLLKNIKKFDFSNCEESDLRAKVMEKFKLLACPEKCFTAQVLSQQKVQDYSISSNMITIYDVLLWGNCDDGDYLLNGLLMKEALTSDTAAVEETENEDEGLRDWNPMAQDYNSVYNSYGVNLDDVEVATYGYKAKDEKYICKYYSRNGKCLRGNACPYVHTFTGCDGETQDIVDTFATTSDNVVNLPEIGSRCLLQVSFFINPGHFYVVFPYGTSPVSKIVDRSGRCQLNKEFKKLSEDINVHYNSAPFKENTTLALAYGNMVAARSSYDKRWYRARVVDVSSVEGPCEVFFVDFGGVELIHRRNIREIEPEYLFCPLQGVECFLENVNPKNYENGRTWSAEARSAFGELVHGVTLMAKVVERIGQVLYVNLQTTACGKKMYISDYLVLKGYAEYASSNDSALRNQYRDHALFLRQPG